MRRLGWVFQSLTALACLVIVAMLAVVLSDIVSHGTQELSLDFLIRPPENQMKEGGILPAIIGTLALVILMTIAVIPLGVATAVYMHEYAPKKSWVLGMVRAAIQNLAGVPAIVFGLFGLGFFIQFVGRGIDLAAFGGEMVYGKACILWASLTMALLTLPTVVVTTEETLRAIPQSYREAAYCLGATRWQVIRKVVLPQAVSGILTGGILAVNRGAGEVAPILLTGVTYYSPDLPTRLTDQFMHLGYHVFILTTQSTDVEATKPVAYATVLVLLLLTLSLNFIAIMIRSRIRRRLRGGR